MDFEQLMGVVYAAMDAVKRGDNDEIEIIRQWGTEFEEEDDFNAFHMIIRRDVAIREAMSRIAPS